MSGTELLTAYRDVRSEGAFADLVRRYSNVVYSIAKRRLGNAPLAEEVTQTVFTRLAHATPKIKGDAELVAWLHRTTVHVAIDVWRSESRRRTREQHAAAMEPAPAETNQLWDEVAPNLDEALNQLGDADRQAVLLRFFERKPMRDIGRVLGVSEDAAKMRVSRAIDRLRAQLALRGITCAVGALTGFLGDRAIEAAPIHLIANLRSIKAPVSGNLAASFGNLGSILLLSRAKIMSGVVALLIGIGLIALLRRSDLTAPDTTATAETAAVDAIAARANRPFPQRAAATVETTEASAPQNVRLLVQVVDAETGEGLADAKVRAAHFGVGGSSQGHDLLTDQTGSVAIPEPTTLEGNSSMNVFVIAEHHVPKVVGLGRNAPAEYTMKLDRALSAGGLVVNQQGEPVAGVKIRMQNPDRRASGPEHATFQLSAATTDADGRWLFPYVPKDLDEIRFILTRDDYAVTLPIVAARKVDLMNLQLVIAPGFTVSGRITDTEGQPIAGVTVKELNNNGYRRQSTTTAADGTFVIQGLRDSLQSHYWIDECGSHDNPNQPFRLGEWDLRLSVQAQGFASETRTVHYIPSETNTVVVDFALPKGRIFRGRIADESGDPIPGAVVRTDTDNDGLRKFDWSTKTDAEGRFEWDSAPTEPVLFWFEAPGYPPKRDVPLVADGTEHEIKLTRNAKE